MITPILNSIIHSDCNEFMASLPPECVDFVLTSPPYDDLRKYKGFTFDFELTAKNLYRILKPGGCIVWVIGDQTRIGSETGSSFRQALYFMSLGLNLHDTMIYGKLNHIPQTHNRYEQAFEYMFCFSKGRPKTFNPIEVAAKTAGATFNLARKGYGFKEGAYRRRNATVTTGETKRATNIFYYACGQSGKNHPAVFPSSLAKDQILTWTKPLDIVYDPFSGSGTTCEGSKKTGRYFLGTETSADYVAESIDRLSKIPDRTFLL